MFYENVIIGGGPSALQLGYYFEKKNINYIILEKESECASFFKNYPISNQLISINKKYTGETNKDFNLRHDWNSLLNDENYLFTDITDQYYPESSDLFRYLNEFSKRFNIKIKFNETVITVNKSSNKSNNKSSSNYEIITDQSNYVCNKLIIASGLSVKNYPPNINIPSSIKINHYGDLDKKTFIQNIHNYKNKKVLLIGGGNASYELANLLEKVCSSVIILGSNKKLSIVSHYVGDIRTVYLPFLDSFYLKSLNGIDVFNKQSTYFIKENLQEHSEDYKKLKFIDSLTNDYYGNKLTYFDDIIFCTGWKFDKTIFKFDVSTVINDKYPQIKNNYESTNNDNLYFIGSLMHSLDYKKGSSGFIHGFRYLIKFFSQINYNIDPEIIQFKFNGNMNCYVELSKHIHNRINTSSSLYQLYGVMCDVFYYDTKTKTIQYIQDWKKDSLQALNIECKHINILQLEYGEEETMIHKLGAFNKWNPSFLHPKIYMYEINNPSPFSLQLLDKVTFEEDLIADFSSSKFYNKIYQTLKMCNLIL